MNIYNDHRYTEIAGLIGHAQNSLVSNCNVTGTILSEGQSTAGLIIALFGSNSKVSNCYFEGVLSGTYGVAGLIMGVGAGEIINCFSEGTISGVGSLGGLVELSWGRIINSYSSMNIYGTYENIGGLVKINNSTGVIENCYFNGNISHYYNNSNDVGGLVGENRGQITNSYSAGYISVTGSSVGGLVGVNYSPGTITNSFYDQQTSGKSDTGKGTPKTTAEMKTQSTFTSWDFTDVWAIEDGTTYPYLRYFTYNANNPKPT